MKFILDYIPVPVDWNQAQQQSDCFDQSIIRFKSMAEPESSTGGNGDGVLGPRCIPNRDQLFHELTGEFNRLIAKLHLTTKNWKPGDAFKATQLWIDFIRFQDLRQVEAGSSSG